MQLKYIIQNSVTKQIAGSFDIDGDRVVELHLTVSKQLDNHFCTVLKHLRAKPDTKIILIYDDGKYVSNIKFAEKVPNWEWDSKKNIFTRKQNEKFAGMFFIWDLIDAVRLNNKLYNITNTIINTDIVNTISNLTYGSNLLYKMFNTTNANELLKKILINKNIKIKDDTTERSSEPLTTERSSEPLKNVVLYQTPVDKDALQQVITQIFGSIKLVSDETSFSLWYSIDSYFKGKKYGIIMPKTSSDTFDNNLIIEPIKLLSKVSDEKISPPLHEHYPFLFFYDDKCKLCFVSQQYESDLFRLNYTKFNANQKREIKEQILKLIDKLLHLNIIYLDIKTDNIVLNYADGIDVRIIDWDLFFTCYSNSKSNVNGLCNLLKNDKKPFFKNMFKLIILLLFLIIEKNTLFYRSFNFNDDIIKLINNMLTMHNKDRTYIDNYDQVCNEFKNSEILDTFWNQVKKMPHEYIFILERLKWHIQVNSELSDTTKNKYKHYIDVALSEFPNEIQKSKDMIYQLLLLINKKNIV